MAGQWDRWRNRHQTVGEWLDEWLAVYVEPRLRDGELAGTTVSSYRGHVRRYLKPELGSIELRRLSPHDITTLYHTMGTPRELGGYGLSARTRELSHVTLRMALDRAVALGRVKTNVMRKGAGVDRPRVRRRRVRALEADDAVRLVRSLASGSELVRRFYVPAVLALATGMRRGEVLALAIEDIALPDERDPDALGVITVRRAWDSIDAIAHRYAPLERYRIREWPKSGRERYIDVPPEVVCVLRVALRERARRKAAAGDAWKTEATRRGGEVLSWGELLICDDEGMPWWPDSFSSAWRSWCKSQGIVCRFHDLRSTSGSISLAAGTDVEAVSARLGHHSAAFFLEHYARAMHRSRTADAAVMGELVARIEAPPEPSRAAKRCARP
ncbi:MAG: tyrosine-type recombinase/integrase [Coriobacteriia bacterium]